LSWLKGKRERERENENERERERENEEAKCITYNVSPVFDELTRYNAVT
jgi:hypothetical protein